MPETMLTTKALGERWSVSPNRLRNDRSARRGPAWIKLGASVRYALKDVITYEEQNRVPTIDPN